jgi:hypothetical protein
MEKPQIHIARTYTAVSDFRQHVEAIQLFSKKASLYEDYEMCPSSCVKNNKTRQTMNV